MEGTLGLGLFEAHSAIFQPQRTSNPTMSHGFGHISLSWYNLEHGAHFLNLLS